MVELQKRRLGAQPLPFTLVSQSTHMFILSFDVSNQKTDHQSVVNLRFAEIVTPEFDEPDATPEERQQRRDAAKALAPEVEISELTNMKPWAPAFEWSGSIMGKVEEFQKENTRNITPAQSSLFSTTAAINEKSRMFTIQLDFATHGDDQCKSSFAFSEKQTTHQ